MLFEGYLFDEARLGFGGFEAVLLELVGEGTVLALEGTGLLPEGLVLADEGGVVEAGVGGGGGGAGEGSEGWSAGGCVALTSSLHE